MFGSTDVVFGVGRYSASVLLRLMVRLKAFNDSQEFVEHQQKFHTDDLTSVRNLVRRSD